MTRKRKMLILVLSALLCVTAIGAGTFVYAKEAAQREADGVTQSAPAPVSQTEKPKASAAAAGAKTENRQKTTAAAVKTTAGQPAKKESSRADAASGTVSLEAAKQIALQYVGLSAAEVTFTSAHEETDDGVRQYDIEFKTASYAYEFEIGLDGQILSFDKDARQTKKKTSTTKKASVSSKYIGIDQAKSIALAHSGYSAGQVTFTKAKLEKDDGVMQYEIEFQTDTQEFEYEIHAGNGKILAQDAELLDDDANG